MIRGRLRRAPADTRHQCQPRPFIFRGPPDGSRWTCPICHREWVWCAQYPGAATGDAYGRSNWHNIEFEDLNQRSDSHVDFRDHGGAGSLTLPMFGSPDDGKYRHWWKEAAP